MVNNTLADLSFVSAPKFSCKVLGEAITNDH